MFRRGSVLVLVALIACAGVLAGCGAGKKSEAGKIAISTSSREARQAYLEGRDLFERLRVTNSLTLYEKAASLDPAFALAELGIANAVPTAKEAFAHMKRAVELAGKATDGERLLILATAAGFNGNTSTQKKYLTELVAAFPDDERAQFNLGVYHYGLASYEDAIACLKKATELAPGYSPAYNALGYAYRETGRFAEAEQAFKKYIELIPDDPNPYDSDAELLLKMGRFQEAVTAYRRALSLDSNFVTSRAGVAAALLYLGRPADATAELTRMLAMARNDAERRTALFVQAVVDADGGRLAAALEQIRMEYAVARQTNDAASMAADLRAQGAILVEMGRFDDARGAFDQALTTIDQTDLAQDVKDNLALLHHHDLVTVALGKRQADLVRSESEEYQKGAAAMANPVLTRLGHELAGRVALAARDYKSAIAELQQADPQNPYNLYRLALAYQATGDAKSAHEYCARAANFNSTPALDYAFIRLKATRALARMKG